jgi:hypothetical protein
VRLPKLDLTGWAIVGCVGAVLFVGAGLARPSFLGLQFDPFGMDARKIDSLTNQRDVARSDAGARTLEAEGERASAGRQAGYYRLQLDVNDLTSSAENEARSTPHADEPLPADLADRIRRNTDGLCDARPAVCGPAPADPAGSSGGAL